MQVNGAAARLVHSGDLIIVFSYAGYAACDPVEYPQVVHVDALNKIVANDDRVADLASRA